jgi:hypothetical protein
MGYRRGIYWPDPRDGRCERRGRIGQWHVWVDGGLRSDGISVCRYCGKRRKPR